MIKTHIAVRFRPQAHDKRRPKMDLKTILAKATEEGASDILIIIGMPPIIRVNTELMMMKNFGDVDAGHAEQMLRSLLDDEKIRFFNEKKDIDFSTTSDDGDRKSTRLNS